MIKCLHCGAETSNGLALCDLCRRAADAYLEFIPIHFGNLSRWRPGRAGARPVPGSREPKADLGGSNEGDRVARCLDEASNDLTTHVRQLADDRGIEVPYAADEVNTVRVACWLLSENLTSIATLDWCGDLVVALHEIEGRLRRLAEHVVPGWYAGACQTCAASTYVVPGLTWVTCGTCGATTYAPDHLDVVLTEAADWLARPRRLAEAIVALVDTEQSVPRLYDRIRKWSEREQITATRRIARGYGWDDDEERFVVVDEEVGPARYRLGDVLDLVFATRGTGAVGDESVVAS